MKTPTIAPQLLIFALVLCSTTQVYTKTAFGQSWERVSGTPASASAEFATVHPLNPDTLFVGAEGNLYVSSNRGKHWRRSLGLGSQAKINRIYFDEDRIFLLTTEGLFESVNGGKNWKKIFAGRPHRQENAVSLSRDPNDPATLYLGTEGGLLLSRDGGRTWQTETNELARQWIYDLDADLINHELFIVSEKGLYRIITHRNRFDRVYVARPEMSSEDMGLETEIADEADLDRLTPRGEINRVLVVHDPFPMVVIGTRSGVLISEDEGNHWERLPSSGLKSVDILDLVYSPNQKSFFAATVKGIFFYNRSEKRWRELGDGLPFTSIYRLNLASGDSETLYAATQSGLYKITIAPELLNPEHLPSAAQNHWNLALELFGDEPTIGMVQRQVIRYANVSNWKTRRWQWASRLRALVPSLSAGKNFSKGATIDIDRAGTNDADRYILGPPNVDESWDFDLRWDLSDLIWNTAQTSIDSREKLMAELRDDFLSEATRVYFERRRTQVDFILNPELEATDRIHELLRIEELTANLDALTGGNFSQQLEELYRSRPKYRELWQVNGEA